MTRTLKASPKKSEAPTKSKEVLLSVDGKEFRFPIVEGSEGERAIDIANLRSDTGLITLDPGYMNTGSCLSSITFIDGGKGILRYRGIPIEDLCAKSDFVEICYLLIYGRLPKKPELDAFRNEITRHSMIHEDMKRLYDGFPRDAHPMAILSSAVNTLSTFYGQGGNGRRTDLDYIRLIAKLPTIAALAYKKSIGQPHVYPRNKFNYAENFMWMMFGVPAEAFKIDREIAKALDLLFILHADHEQNCSASTVRLVGSSKANLYTAIAAGISALWGPLHGGANQSVLEMLEQIHKDGGDVKKWVAKAKDGKDGFRLMGFGHRVYKNFDPRARIIKKHADNVLKKLGVEDPLLDIAMELEEAALKDSYFVERKLYPNVDFYSGIIYKALGIPTNMFTVMFALGRLPGWIAQFKELVDAPFKIGRPRQIYTGPTLATYTPIGKR
ncbi:MAG: citrate (Si)-synthase [Elusimicrobia bacterium CG_4_9_14_3_um_filter_62_55]|nr:MAG: citrate (Si)-synthase [Elusimicrobia bacterium CG22_combo_CG10-13_8_21_14_all_63_91]PJA18301.1 MAG: citrate (Si)-synthase [Elusimicrobia bacterium CG_4_10_14_0_2_um_filter_63_34]PJB23442.1 MAG: citrate (Si)-synthase [Elusimicrobia bacterium CG_4_9_14_3_um_filter_62_55]